MRRLEYRPRGLIAIIALINDLHGGTPPVLFVNDQSITGISYRRGFEEWLGGREDQIDSVTRFMALCTWMFGSGIISGPLIDAHLQGEKGAKLVIGVLEGSINPQVFRLESSPSRYYFD